MADFSKSLASQFVVGFFFICFAPERQRVLEIRVICFTFVAIRFWNVYLLRPMFQLFELNALVLAKRVGETTLW